MPVLSEKFKWNEKGVEILGSVPVHITGGFLKSPFRPEAIKHLRRTTSTAACVFPWPFLVIMNLYESVLMPFLLAHSVVSVVGFLDSIVAAKQNGSRYGHSISPNRCVGRPLSHAQCDLTFVCCSVNLIEN